MNRIAEKFKHDPPPPPPRYYSGSYGGSDVSGDSIMPMRTGTLSLSLFIFLSLSLYLFIYLFIALYQISLSNLSFSI